MNIPISEALPIVLDAARQHAAINRGGHHTDGVADLQDAACDAIERAYMPGDGSDTPVAFDLASIGAALYGDHWHTQMARALPAASKSIYRWASGERKLPPQYVQKLHQLVVERRAQLQAIERQLSIISPI